MDEKDCSKTTLSKQIKEKLSVISASQKVIVLIIAAILLSYYTTGVQKEQLICSVANNANCDCLPDVFPLQSASSFMIIIASLFFFSLSVDGLKTPQDNCVTNQANEANYISSALILIAAIIRIFSLYQVHASRKTSVPSPGVEYEEDIATELQL